MWYVVICAVVLFGLAVTLGMVTGLRAADEGREDALREWRQP
jgi:hypothetical protein